MPPRVECGSCQPRPPMRITSVKEAASSLSCLRECTWLAIGGGNGPFPLPQLMLLCRVTGPHSFLWGLHFNRITVQLLPPTVPASFTPHKNCSPAHSPVNLLQKISKSIPREPNSNTCSRVKLWETGGCHQCLLLGRAASSQWEVILVFQILSRGVILNQGQICPPRDMYQCL